MKISEKAAALCIGGSCTILFVTLLVANKIGPGVFATLIGFTMLVSIAIAVISRLQEFNLREMKLILEKIEKTKAEVEQMYGGIEHLKFDRVKPDEAYYNNLGLFASGGFIHCGSVVNFVMGCMKRERERIAKIFINDKSPEQVAAAIVDGSLDKKVFKWVGPGASLDDPPPPAAE